jgi:hypothetical protein
LCWELSEAKQTAKAIFSAEQPARWHKATINVVSYSSDSGGGIRNEFVNLGKAREYVESARSIPAVFLLTVLYSLKSRLIKTEFGNVDFCCL